VTRPSDEAAHDPGQPDVQSRGRADLSRHYRQLPVDTVPEELDQLILQHARAAVAKPAASSNRFWMRWGLPLGCAASALLAATLMFDRARIPQAPARAAARNTQQNTSQEPADRISGPAVAQAPAATGAEEPNAKAASGSLARDIHATLRAPVVEVKPGASVANAARTADLPADAATVEELIITGSYIRGSAEDAALPIDVITAKDLESLSPGDPLNILPAVGAGSASASDQPEQTSQVSTSDADAEPQAAAPQPDASSQLTGPKAAERAVAEQRLNSIREMRASGRKRAADAAWRKFRRDYPDYPVAADDIARARTP